MNMVDPVAHRKFGKALYILAGLLPEVGNSIMNKFDNGNEFKKVSILLLPGSKREPVYKDDTLAEGFRRVKEFILSNYDENSSLINPSKIVVLYAPSCNERSLLERLGLPFFCAKLPFNGDDAKSQRRYPESAFDIIKSKIDALERNGSILDNFVKEISDKRKTTPLLLPPQNFQPSSRTYFSERLWNIIFNGMQLGSIMTEFNLKKYNSDSLPKFLTGRKKILAYTDYRNLVFPACKDTERHALPRQLLSNDYNTIQLKLNELYRFGVPILDGFHYDVQKTGNNSLNGIAFKCSNSGDVSTKKPHINIYPNDRIRL